VPKRVVAGALAFVFVSLVAPSAAVTAVTGPSPPRDVAWVATEASVTDPGNAITPVNLTSHTVEPRVTVGSLPSAMAFTRGDESLLVVSQGADELYEIDPRTDRVERSVTVGVEPDAVAVAPGGTSHSGVALVANLKSNSVTPVDLGTWKAGQPIPAGNEPVAIEVAGTGTAFVADFGSNLVTPINLTTRRPGPAIAVGKGPETLAVVGSEVLVGNFGDDTLSRIAMATMLAAAPVPLPIDPTGIAVTRSGTMAYISGGASVIPLVVAGFVVGRPITLSGVAQAIALGRDDRTAWVALQAGSLQEVNLASGKVGRAIHLGGHTSALAIATG
jgi:hyaluronoglucosaminidase